MRSNKASISFKLRVYMIDQNINIKAKKNIMFSIAWFSKLRLNGTFIHLNKIANAHISYHDVQSLSEKKVEKYIKKKKLCIQEGMAKPYPHCYHFLPYISQSFHVIHAITFTHASTQATSLMCVKNRRHCFSLQSNLHIMTTWGTKFLRML